MSEPSRPISTENDTEAWTYAPSLSDAPKHTIYGPRGEVFATVYRSKDRARLVAAAPELLHALKNLYALVQGECPSLLEGDHHDTMVCAAIAKAEGRS